MVEAEDVTGDTVEGNPLSELRLDEGQQCLYHRQAGCRGRIDLLLSSYFDE